MRFNLKSTAKIAVLFAFVVFVGLQFIPSKRNESNRILETDFEKTFRVPSEIRTILKTACYDCHSNNTRYPWYNRLQPAAWFMEGHITEGKEELNFSDFGSYSNRRQKTKLRSIVSQVKGGEMPLPSYTYIHWDARLSEDEKRRFVKYIEGLRSGL